MQLAETQTSPDPQTPPRRVPPVLIRWDRVDDLMAKADLTDADLARAGEVPQSTIHRARRGAASASAIRAVARSFPGTSLDDLLQVPAA